MSDLHPSVRATYDSRETGPRYWQTTTVNDRPIAFRQPIPDPFARTTVTLGVRDLLVGLLRRRLVVEVTIGAEKELMYDVLELDENELVRGRTRQAAFQQSMHERLSAFGEELPDE
jgi:hypothetical protein